MRRGVAIDLAAISVDERLVPGGSYRLPPVRIRNPATAETAYEMALRPGGEGLETPSEWLRFTPATFTLASGAAQTVDVALVVPPGAPDGRYTGLLTAQIVDPRDGGTVTGARVGAAAATRLDFQVVPRSLLAGWFNALRRLLLSTTPWSWLMLGCLVVALILWLLSRRFRLRVEHVPRSS